MLAPSQAPHQIALLREVATGPSSAVFVASCRRDWGASLAAVKVVRPRDRRSLERLITVRDRGRALALLQHRHIVAVTDLVRVGDYPALVSPWVDGVDLLDWVEILRETGTVFPGRVICEIVRGVAMALDAAENRAPWPSHEPLGFIHRDIKPSNILIGRDGEVAVVDFGTGFSSLAGRGARTGALKRGLVKYLSPGRRDGKRASAAGDIYALGIVAVELFRGRWLRRLRAKNPAHDRHLAEVVATIGRLDMRTTQDDQTLRSLLLRMVAFDSEARPSAAEAAQTFRILADRAVGPSLEHFAHDQLVPWLEPVPTEPAPELRALQTKLITDSEALEAIPVYEPDPTQTRGGSSWEETEEGWSHRGHDESMLTQEDPLDESTNITLKRLVRELEDATTDDVPMVERLTHDQSDTPPTPLVVQPPPEDSVREYDTDTQTVEVEMVTPRSAPSATRSVFAGAFGLAMGALVGGVLAFGLAWMLFSG